MAFIGTPVFAEVSTRVLRITGLTIDDGESGVFGLHGDAGAEVQLPAGFQPADYSDIDLAESIEVSWWQINQAEGSFGGLKLAANKTTEPFRIQMVNGGGDNSGEMEIWLRFH
jgi:hypothetical protein